MKFHDTIRGIEIDCDSTLSYICFKADWFESSDGWFFQGSEADDVMAEINGLCESLGDISVREAAARWAGIYLH